MNEHIQVMEAIEDRFYEEGLLSNKGDIAEWTGLSKSTVGGRLEELEGNQVYRVYEGEGLPTIYVTQQMKNSLTTEVSEPEWLPDYEFGEKRDLRDQVGEANDKISEYQTLERLLYGTGDPLEEAVEYALDKLNFELDSTEEDEDFTIEYEGDIWVIEVKGKSGKIDKENINQLGGWLEQKIEQGYDPENVTGVLLYNHERNTAPDDRSSPLTEHATRFLGIFSAKQVSTVELFDIVKDHIEGAIDTDTAQQRFFEQLS